MNKYRRNTFETLARMGIADADAAALVRASATLHRWHELECGTGTGQTSISVERDEGTGKCYRRVQYPMPRGYVDRKWPTADRETGAIRRAQAIAARYGLAAYVQGDPRGCALYLLRPGDVPDGCDASGYYSRGIAVVP